MKANFTIKHNTDLNWKMVKGHFHDGYEILLSLSEGCNFFINKDTYHLKKGSLVFISEGTLHHSFAKEGTSYERYVLHVPAGTLRNLSSEQTNFVTTFKELNCCIDLGEAPTEHIRWLCENCLQHDGNRFGEDLRRITAFSEMLLYFCELLEQKKYVLPQKSAEFARVAPIIDHIIQFIDEHVAEPLPLELLATHFSINKYYLCHLFKEATGFTVVEYMNNRRVLKACALLRQGANVRKAAEDSGFASSAHFIRIFRKLCGTTPGQYAKSHKNQHNQVSLAVDKYPPYL